MALNANISVFTNTYATEKPAIYNVNYVFDLIQQGEYMTTIQKLRCAPDKETEDKIKRSLPVATFCAAFQNKSIAGFDKDQASGLIVMDFDKFDSQNDAEKFRDRIAKDPYCFAAFVSCRGKGVAAVFRVSFPKSNEDNHLIYRSLSEYCAANFDYIESDPSCKDITRGRILSWDPGLKRKQLSETQTWEKRAAPIPKKVQSDISKANATPVRFEDLEYIIAQIENRNIPLCDTYSEYLSVAFAFAREFGEDGREYFFRITNEKPSAKSNNQYDACLRHAGSGDNTITWGSFVKLCRDKSIEVQTPETKIIISAAISHKKSGTTAEECAKTLSKFEGIDKEKSIELIKKVFANNFTANPDEKVPPLIAVERWIKTRDFKLNSFSHEIEFELKFIDENKMNSLYFQMLREVFGGEKKVTISDFKMLLRSDIIESYNPVQDYFQSLGQVIPNGKEIKKLARALKSPTGGDTYIGTSTYVEHFLRKWLVQTVAIAFGEPTDLMLILTGEEGRTGKSYFFKNILPETEKVKLKRYVGSFRLDQKNDLKDEMLLMTQKLIVFIDDAEKKDLKNSGVLKSLITSDVFNVRKPYGQVNEDIPKRAMLCASSNITDFVENSKQNRRMLPILITENFYDEFIKIDINEVWAEAYSSYKLQKKNTGWLCNAEDVFLMQKVNLKFESEDFLENEMLRIFEKSESPISLAEIATVLAQRSGIEELRKLNAVQLGMRLAKVANTHPMFGKVGRKYYVREKSTTYFIP